MIKERTNKFKDGAEENYMKWEDILKLRDNFDQKF